MSAQPEALRLADLIERYNSGVHSQAIFEDYSKAAAELLRLHAQLTAANKACNDLAIKLEQVGKERDYWHARLLAEAGSVDKLRHAAKTILADIEALPVRSTGYPPYQHSPDWMRQQAADVVRKHLAEKA